MSTFSPAMTEALARFIDQPGPPAIEALLASSKEFVLVQARSWRQAGLAFVDRCREIMSELFLILTEDVDADKAAGPASLLAYLALRLRRLTRPKTGKIIPLGLDTDLPEVGRCGFTPFRLELVREIVRSVRLALATEAHAETRSLEFLFLHVIPEMAWGSRLLARAESREPGSRLEADKKRHQAFNRNLRARFDAISCADWRDILTWSPGERSHLAWSIIELSGAESGRLTSDDLTALESWRTDPGTAEGDPKLVVGTLPRFLTAISHVHRPRMMAVAEPRAAYGAQPDEDLLALLFRYSPPQTGKKVASPIATLETDKGPNPSASGRQPSAGGDGLREPDTAEAEEAAFNLALAEVLEWSQGILGQSRPRTRGRSRPANGFPREYPPA